jgi:hypothetical protein
VGLLLFVNRKTENTDGKETLKNLQRDARVALRQLTSKLKDRHTQNNRGVGLELELALIKARVAQKPMPRV